MIMIMKSRNTRQTEHVAAKKKEMRKNAYIYIYIWGENIYRKISYIFTLRRMCGFSLILNDSFSDDGLKRRTKLVTIVNC